MTAAHTFLHPGSADATALVLAEPLSLWGGTDVATGAIIDNSHPDLGSIVAGKVLVMPSGRGSSSSSSVLAEAIRRGTAPAGILLGRPDPILAVGAIVAELLYGRTMPVVVGPISQVRSGDRVTIEAGTNRHAQVKVSPGRG